MQAKMLENNFQTNYLKTQNLITTFSFRLQLIYSPLKRIFASQRRDDALKSAH